jgi:broad specificity phosphatase PhoE
VTVRLLLVTHLMTRAVRRAAFPADEPIEASPGVLMRPREGTRLRRGPEQRCAQTCERMGLTAEADEVLSDWDLGRWRGSTLDEIAVAERDAVTSWLADPSAAPHGGESLTALLSRASAWLGGLADGSLVAVTHPAVVRAAVVAALGSPPAAFWRLDVAPATVTSLSGRNDRWNVSRMGAPLLMN